MDLGATLTNAFVVVVVGAILAYLTTDRLRSLRRETDRLRAEMADGLEAFGPRWPTGLEAFGPS